jgi:hypothetical protein
LINRLDIKNLEKTYVGGFTVDREVRKGVCEYAKDEGAPIEGMVSAAEGYWGSWQRSGGGRSCFKGWKLMNLGFGRIRNSMSTLGAYGVMKMLEIWCMGY